MVQGTVAFFDIRKGFGNIKGPDETMYFFSKSSLQEKGRPDRDQKVEFSVDKSAEVKEGQKQVAVEVKPVDGEGFNTERRRKKPAEKGAEKKADGKTVERIVALEKALKSGGGGNTDSRLDKLEGKINELCEKAGIKKLGASGGGRSRGKGKGKRDSATDDEKPKKGSGKRSSRGKKSEGEKKK